MEIISARLRAFCLVYQSLVCKKMTKTDFILSVRQATHSFNVFVKIVKQWIGQFWVSQSVKFSVNNNLVNNINISDSQSGRGGGVTRRKIGLGWAACFLKPLSFFRAKSAIFPAIFESWPKIWYSISDLTLKINRLFQTHLIINALVYKPYPILHQNC